LSVSGFYGIEPRGLVGLADSVDEYAQRIASVRANTAVVFHRYGLAEHFGMDWRLAAAQQGLTGESRELRWRAGVIESAQRFEVNVGGLPAGFGLDRFAARAVFDLDTWQADYQRWRLEGTMQALTTMEPADRVAVFLGMTARDASWLAHHYPDEMGSLAGAPVGLRYVANQMLIRHEMELLDEQRTQLRDQWRGQIVTALISALSERIAEYQRWLDEGRQILVFDPRGDGRVVEVFGDLDGAGRIAVVVPGTANDLGNFSEEDGGFRADASDLLAATSGTGIATIAWLGYDPPDSLGATMRNSANEGAAELQRFLAEIDPQEDRAITVIAHSYGSVLAGTAARLGLEANDLVFVGSPGTTLASASDAVLRPGGRVWVALAERDPIALGINPSELPPWWVPPVLWAPWLGFDLLSNGAEELWHGPNPASEEFGARRVATVGSTGHSDYFEAGSLENLARIVEGLYSEVELCD
jgi:pimeloyl-ACP methyl ester carboxylesterase